MLSSLAAILLLIASPQGPAVAEATPAEEPPVLDGEVLGEHAWHVAAALTDFWQTTPDEGQPSSERTEVRLLYTRDTLYVGVVCHDREPGRIVVNESRRDASLEDTDSFQVILDTYLDRQNGFVFGTNPAGLEYDGQVTNEGGEDNGSLGGFNKNWDASWQVRIWYHVHEQGGREMASSAVRHKHVRIDQAKLEKAKRILEARTDTETLDRALSLVVTEGKIDAVFRAAGGKGTLKKVFR